MFRAIAASLVHSVYAGRKEHFKAPVGLVGDVAGNMKGIAPKSILVDLGSQFCWESQQRR